MSRGIVVGIGGGEVEGFVLLGGRLVDVVR